MDVRDIAVEELQFRILEIDGVVMKCAIMKCCQKAIIII